MTKVVVGLCAVLPFRGRPLLTGPWLLNSIPHWRHSLQGTRQNWTDLSHHAQLSMCTSRDKMAASGMEFSVLIECEFVAVVSWIGWWCFFHTKFALVRTDDWWVSFTRPWAVFTRLGRPDEWLVRTLAYMRHSASMSYTPTLNKVEGGYTGFTLPICLSVDRIVSTLYLLQHWLDPFRIYTAYQATWEGVSCVNFFSNSDIWSFGKFFKFVT